MNLDVIDNFLPVGMPEELINYTMHTRSCESNYSCWPTKIVGRSAAILCWPMDDIWVAEKLRPIVLNRLQGKKSWNPKFANNPWGVTVHFGSPGSHIPWHPDDTKMYSITVYLNQRWEWNHGGYLIVDEPVGTKKNPRYQKQVFNPTYNLAICFKAPMMHCVTPTTSDAPIRYSLQIFMADESKKKI